MKGICFKEPLFNKVVDGSKNQTRRLVNHNHDAYPHFYQNSQSLFNSKESDCVILADSICTNTPLKKEFRPRYNVGDVVFLKEPYFNYKGEIIYKYLNEDIACNKPFDWKGWENKLFMPVWAARYYIEIISVKCERLQEISDEDCFAEGITINDYGYSYPGNKVVWSTPQKAYAMLINSIDGLGTWNKNPFVWVYDFELVKK